MLEVRNELRQRLQRVELSAGNLCCIALDRLQSACCHVHAPPVCRSKLLHRRNRHTELGAKRLWQDGLVRHPHLLEGRLDTPAAQRRNESLDQWRAPCKSREARLH